MKSCERLKMGSFILVLPGDLWEVDPIYPYPPDEQFLRQENHLRLYVAIMVIIAAIVAFVILVAIMIQQRNQVSKEISKEHADTAPATWNRGMIPSPMSWCPRWRLSLPVPIRIKVAL